MFQDLEDLANKDEANYKKFKLMEAEFSDVVDIMRQNKYLNHSAINDLMILFWRLVGNKITPVATGLDIKSLSFCCGKKDQKVFAYVFCPLNWHDMLVADTNLQMGALVFIASQAKDFWNGLIEKSSNEVTKRAMSYEAELLHFFAKTKPNFNPTDYQNKVMQKFPLGIASEHSNYVGKPYN